MGKWRSADEDRHHGTNEQKRNRRPFGVTWLVAFFAFGVTMRGLTILLLVFPETLWTPLGG
jgi:hypothetical protein